VARAYNQQFDSCKFGVVREAPPIGCFAADKKRQAANAEIRIIIVEDDRHFDSGAISRTRSAALIPRIASTYDEQEHELSDSPLPSGRLLGGAMRKDCVFSLLWAAPAPANETKWSRRRLQPVALRTNPGTSSGLIPTKVSEAERASVTAGLANEVEAANQYAAVT